VAAAVPILERQAQVVQVVAQTGHLAQAITLMRLLILAAAAAVRATMQRKAALAVAE
jgi:hypothetical protein